MRLTRYVVGSFVVAGGLVYHALKTREQYFPAMLYLSTSKLSVVVMGNLMFALTLCLGHLFKAIFLGQLREAEVERLYERSKDAIMETCLAMTIFREEFNVKFVVMFVTLLFVKIFHWLCSDRVEYVETSPSTTRLAHLRVCTLAACLLALDLTMLQYSVTETLRLGPSVLLLFGFEYIILASKVVATSCKYLIFAIDTWREGRWDEKGTYVFYLELARQKHEDVARRFAGVDLGRRPHGRFDVVALGLRRIKNFHGEGSSRNSQQGRPFEIRLELLRI